MKHIQKRNEPKELRVWRDKQYIDGKYLNCTYDDMPGGIKQVIKQQLLLEQGYLCCYTGQRIDENNSHIEHFKPQTRCGELEDVNYSNLLAAFPAGNLHAEYGAHAKAGYDETLLVSPLNGACEKRFRYNQDGSVEASNKHDTHATKTVDQLCLNNSELVDLRKKVIADALFKFKISQAQLARIVDSYCERNPEEKFRPFCFVIQQISAKILANKQQKSKGIMAKNAEQKRNQRRKP